MKTLIGVAAVASAAAACAVAWFAFAPARADAPAAASPRPQLAEQGTPRFPDFGFLPPASEFHPERTFRLSQDFPVREPEIDPAVRRILAIDYAKDWRAYADATLDYVLQGNIENRDISQAFFLEDNPVRRWYHVPWQHWGDSGREGLHGMTAEGPSPPFTLGPRQKTPAQTYAVGFYNDRGGYLIGKVWADADNPRPDIVRQDGGFPVGTVVAKLLFTTAPVGEVDYLSNPIEWTAYTKTHFAPNVPDTDPPTPRRVTLVRLIQVDIMVRDDRAKATGGWVFGTFIYNGALGRPNLWRNLVPLGLMWGNDPAVKSHMAGNGSPTATLTNPDLRETVINPDAAKLPPQHLGFGLRLSGAVDNTLSSCKSCHMTAEYPQESGILPGYSRIDGRALTCADPEWFSWFRNLGPTDSFDPGAYPMDNSLQLAGSIQNFLAARNLSLKGYYATQYWKGKRVTSVYDKRGVPPEGGIPCNPPVKTGS